MLPFSPAIRLRCSIALGFAFIGPSQSAARNGFGAYPVNTQDCTLRYKPQLPSIVPEQIANK